MAGTFELKRSRDQFMWNLKAGNGKVVLTSERYKTKRSAENGIASVRKNCRSDSCYDRRKAKNGKPCFSMVAKNGEIIGMSQMYASTSGREAGIRSVKANAGRAKINDIT